MTIVLVELSVESDSFGLGRVLRDGGDVHIDLARFVPTGEALVPYFWLETTDEGAFEKSVRANDQVTSLTPLDSGSNRTLYRIEWTDKPDGFLSLVMEHDLLVEEGSGTADRWQFRLRGPDHENLASFQKSLRERGISVEIHRVWKPDESSDDSYRLTAKQREALELAFAEGYFEVPRNASLASLGEQLDVTPQSLSRRIRRGLHAVLKNTVMNR